MIIIMNNGIWTCRVCGIDYHYYIIVTSRMEHLSCEKWKISKISASMGQFTSHY